MHPTEVTRRPSRRDSTRTRPGFRRSFLIAAAAAAGSAAGAGVREAYAFGVERIRAAVPSLAAPVRIAFLSDLHFGPFVRAGSVRAWVDTAMATAPDLILLGGDLVDGLAWGDPAELLDELEGLSAPLGVHSVWGNHDHKRFGDLRPFRRDLRAVGIDVLDNRGSHVRDDLFLAGIDDYRLGAPDVPAALRERDPEAACLLLSHNPDVLPEVPGEVDLTLCGHTHGGQVQIPGVGPVLTSSAHGRRFAEGWVRAPALGYVSRGLGIVRIPVRLACPAELTVLDLEGGAEMASPVGAGT